MLDPVRLLARLALVLALLCWAKPLSAAGTSESQLKAAFLYNFVQFVTWPAQALGEPNAPIVIGVMGSDPFGSDLEDVLGGQSVRGRKLILRRFPSGGAAPSCHVLYISPSETKNLSAILQRVRGSPILTVGDGVDFARAGGIIGFYLQESRIRLAINSGAASRAGLFVSSQLLKVALILKE